MFLTVLSPVPIIFVAIFLYRAPLGELDSTAKTLSIAAAKHPAPVVLIVFDEFAEPTLMGPNHLIDAGRFPNFAKLAATSNWYRNANSVHEHTPDAVPAILTGQNPVPGALPVAQDHPDNIFTLLGGDYGDRRLRIRHPALPEPAVPPPAGLVRGAHHLAGGRPRSRLWRPGATEEARGRAAFRHRYVAGLQRRGARRLRGAEPHEPGVAGRGRRRSGDRPPDVAGPALHLDTLGRRPRAGDEADPLHDAPADAPLPVALPAGREAVRQLARDRRPRRRRRHVDDRPLGRRPGLAAAHPAGRLHRQAAWPVAGPPRRRPGSGTRHSWSSRPITVSPSSRVSTAVP